MVASGAWVATIFVNFTHPTSNRVVIGLSIPIVGIVSAWARAIFARGYVGSGAVSKSRRFCVPFDRVYLRLIFARTWLPVIVF